MNEFHTISGQRLHCLICGDNHPADQCTEVVNDEVRDLTERRERYAAAHYGIPPEEWARLTLGARVRFLESSRTPVDQTTAVADEEHDLIREAAEFHQRRFTESQQQNARLRAELEERKTAHGEASAEATQLRLDVADFSATIDSLRAELEAVKAVLGRTQDKSADAHATIERVRAAIADTGPYTNVGVADIRAALDNN